MRKAISYCAMRVSVSGSPSASACRWLSAWTPSSIRAARRAIDAVGVARGTGPDPLPPRSGTPGCSRRAGSRCPTAGRRAPGRWTCSCRCEVMTTKVGEVLVERPEPVGEPGPEAGPAGQLVAGVDDDGGRLVVDRLGVHRLARRQRSSTTFAVQGSRSLTQVPLCPCGANSKTLGRDGKALLPGGHRREALASSDRVREILVEHLPQLRLVVPRVDLRGGAGREEPDGAPRPRAEVREPREPARAPGEEPRVREHRGQRDRADAPPGPGEQLPAAPIVRSSPPEQQGGRSRVFGSLVICSGPRPG